MKNMGDSGTFGSQKTMNAIKQMQDQSRTVKRPVNQNIKKQLTGKIGLTKRLNNLIMGK